MLRRKGGSGKRKIPGKGEPKKPKHDFNKVLENFQKGIRACHGDAERINRLYNDAVQEWQKKDKSIAKRVEDLHIKFLLQNNALLPPNLLFEEGKRLSLRGHFNEALELLSNAELKVSQFSQDTANTWTDPFRDAFRMVFGNALQEAERVRNADLYGKWLKQRADHFFERNNVTEVSHVLLQMENWMKYDVADPRKKWKTRNFKELKRTISNIEFMLSSMQKSPISEFRRNRWPFKN